MSIKPQIVGALLGVVILFLFILAGFQSEDNGDWQALLSSGKQVHCSHAHRNYCGVNFSHCSDGLEYECQVNVTIIKGEENK